jgi:hypothetical protein
MYDSEPINYTLDLLDSTEGLIHTPLKLFAQSSRCFLRLNTSLSFHKSTSFLL